MKINPVILESLHDVTEAKDIDKFFIFRKNIKGEYESYEVSPFILDQLIIKSNIIPVIQNKILAIIQKYEKLIYTLNEKFIKSSDAEKLFATKQEYETAKSLLLSKDSFENNVSNTLADISQINYVRSYIFSTGQYKKFRVMSEGANPLYTSNENGHAIKENLTNKARDG